MSALDMVLQRQVPARSPARAGDGMLGGDAANGSMAGAFSEALSNEKRNSPSEQGKVISDSEVKVENDGAVKGEKISPQSGQPDDILNLLAGLKSSATYSDEAELGASSGEEVRPVEAEGQESPNADVIDSSLYALAPTADKAAALPSQASSGAGSKHVGDDKGAITAGDGLDEVSVTVPGASDVDNDESAVTAGEDLDQVSVSVPEASDVGIVLAPAAGNPADAGGKAAAQPTTATGAGDVNDAGKSAEVRAAVAATRVPDVNARLAPTMTTPPAQMTAAGLAPLSASTQQRAPVTSAGSDQPTASSSLKEALQALGLEGRTAQTGAAGGREESDARSAGKQSGTDDKRIDELTTKKDGKIEVIESRRFMPAQNLSANAQMLTRSLAEAGTSALAGQRASSAQPLAQPALPQAGQTLHTLKLQLNPVSLGSVTAVLKLSGEELSVEIKVQTAEAYRQMKDDNQSILKALRGQGFGVEQITVQHVVGPERTPGQVTQQGFQGGQQNPGANDAQSSGRDSSGNNTGQQQSGSQKGQSHEQNSYAGAGRTDGVYL